MQLASSVSSNKYNVKNNMLIRDSISWLRKWVWFVVLVWGWVGLVWFLFVGLVFLFVVVFVVFQQQYAF